MVWLIAEVRQSVLEPSKKGDFKTDQDMTQGQDHRNTRMNLNNSAEGQKLVKMYTLCDFMDTMRSTDQILENASWQMVTESRSVLPSGGEGQGLVKHEPPGG